jgi:hypothetical protein
MRLYLALSVIFFVSSCCAPAFASSAALPVTSPLCAKLPASVVSSIIGKPINAFEVQTSETMGETHICSYSFGDSKLDRIDVTFSVKPSVFGNFPPVIDGPPLSEPSCTTMGPSEKSIVSCDASLTTRVQVVVVGPGAVLTEAFGIALINAIGAPAHGP